MFANSTMVSQSFVHADSHATSHKKFLQAICQSFRMIPPISTEQNFCTSGPEGFRKELSHRGIAEQATKLITKSRRTVTQGIYKSTWKKWTSCCNRQEIDPFQCSLNYALEYLRTFYNNGNLRYRANGVRRSAISDYHTYVDDKAVGQFAPSPTNIYISTGCTSGFKLYQV